MNEQRMREMQQRMLRNYRNGGIGLIVIAPLLWAFMPLGGPILGVLALGLGIASISSAMALSRRAKLLGK